MLVRQRTAQILMNWELLLKLLLLVEELQTKIKYKVLWHLMQKVVEELRILINSSQIFFLGLINLKLIKLPNIFNLRLQNKCKLLWEEFHFLILLTNRLLSPALQHLNSFSSTY